MAFFLSVGLCRAGYLVLVASAIAPLFVHAEQHVLHAAMEHGSTENDGSRWYLLGDDDDIHWHGMEKGRIDKVRG